MQQKLTDTGCIVRASSAFSETSHNHQICMDGKVVRGPMNFWIMQNSLDGWSGAWKEQDYKTEEGNSGEVCGWTYGSGH